MPDNFSKSNASCQTATPTKEVNAVPTPIQIAYAVLRGMDFKTLDND